MKKQNWKTNIIYLILILIYIFAIPLAFEQLQEYQKKTFNLTIYIDFILKLLYYMGFGIIIGLQYILLERKKKGVWKAKKEKLLILGIPSFILSIYWLIYYNNFSIVRPLSNLLESIFSPNPSSIALSQILFGYAITTSCYKENNQYDNASD